MMPNIRRDDLSGAAIRGLLAEHLHSMTLHSPPESIHALDVEALRRPEVTFWSAWDGEELLGCGALMELDPAHGEIKSMRTATPHLRRGVARSMLEHIIAEARRRGYRRLSLETGSAAAFDPARRLYASYGFEYCGPFADYVLDPYSVFMTKALEPALARGGCLCGAVGFSAAMPAKWVAHCHCTRCQRAHGAAFVTWAGVEASVARIDDPEGLLHWHAGADGGERAFCTRCGSPMFFRSTRWPGELHIARALFRDPVTPAPQVHAFHDTRVEWIQLGDALPRRSAQEILK